MTPEKDPRQQAFEDMLAADIRRERRLFWGEIGVLVVIAGFVVLREMYLGVS